MSDHPIHPAFVHHPMAFLTVSYILDIAYGVATHPATAKTVASVYDVTPHLGEIAKFAHYLNILGLLFAIPAVMSGGQQLMTMIKKQDLAAKFEKSQNKSTTAKKMHPKMKLGFAHASMVYLCIGTSVYNWWVRSTRDGYVADELSPFISAGTLIAMSAAGWAGAAMVYDHGVGVVPASKRSKAE